MSAAADGLVAAREHFAGHPTALAVLERVWEAVQPFDGCAVQVTKSQVAFRRRHGFAYLWLPGRYLSRPGADVVLSFALGRGEESARLKEVVQVSPHHWMHHLEVHDVRELDAQVLGWLAEAAARAG